MPQFSVLIESEHLETLRKLVGELAVGQHSVTSSSSSGTGSGGGVAHTRRIGARGLMTHRSFFFERLFVKYGIG